MPMRWLAEWFMKLLGWRVTGEEELPDRFVAIGAPHTSNWDFMLFLAAVSHFRINAKVIGKHTLAKGFFGRFFRAMGVIPVDREKHGGIVEQMKAEFEASGSMALVVAPEGTRSKTDHWKSGFYRIALGADVPVATPFHRASSVGQSRRSTTAFVSYSPHASRGSIHMSSNSLPSGSAP